MKGSNAKLQGRKKEGKKEREKGKDREHKDEEMNMSFTDLVSSNSLGIVGVFRNERSHRLVDICSLVISC